MQPDDHMINAGQETNARGKDVALLAKGVVSYIAKGSSPWPTGTSRPRH